MARIAPGWILTAPEPPKIPAELIVKVPAFTVNAPVYALLAALSVDEPLPILVMPFGTAAVPMAPVKLMAPVPIVLSVRAWTPKKPPEIFKVDPLSAPIQAAAPSVIALEIVLVPLTLSMAPAELMPELLIVMTPEDLLSVMSPASCRAVLTLLVTVRPPVAPLRLLLLLTRKAPALIVHNPVKAELSPPKINVPRSLLVKVLVAALVVKALLRVRVLPDVTSMPVPVMLSLTVRSEAKVPAARSACPATLSRTTFVESPNTPSESADNCNTPPVTSMIEPPPPKVLPALLKTSVPAPDLVRTIFVEPVWPPLTRPENVRPGTALE